MSRATYESTQRFTANGISHGRRDCGIGFENECSGCFALVALADKLNDLRQWVVTGSVSTMH